MRKIYLVEIAAMRFYLYLCKIESKTVDKLFSSFEGVRVMIIGDVMIDSYLWGKAGRISPEAPVPVVNIKKREKRLGGAANVALNIKALGGIPLVCASIGNDDDAHSLLGLFEQHQMSIEGIVRDESRITTVKHRILAGSQHLLRVDSEDDSPCSDAVSEKLFERISALLPSCEVVIFEDYDKGVITPFLIEKVVTLANSLQIPTAVDPKKRNFTAYKNCSLFKPNLKELAEGLKIQIDEPNWENLRFAAQELKRLMNIRIAFITLSEYGVYISNFEEDFWIPAHKREIADVSGAGDTVISIAAMCLAKNLAIKHLASLSNLGGGLVCEFLGVVPINKELLFKEAKSSISLTENLDYEI